MVSFHFWPSLSNYYKRIIQSGFNMVYLEWGEVFSTKNNDPLRETTTEINLKVLV